MSAPATASYENLRKERCSDRSFCFFFTSRRYVRGCDGHLLGRMVDRPLPPVKYACSVYPLPPLILKDGWKIAPAINDPYYFYPVWYWRIEDQVAPYRVAAESVA